MRDTRTSSSGMRTSSAATGERDVFRTTASMRVPDPSDE
jgi:hypothetical protein